MRARQISTNNVRIRRFEKDFWIDLWGNSYANISKAEAKKLYEFLGKALGGEQVKTIGCPVCGKQWGVGKVCKECLGGS